MNARYTYLLALALTLPLSSCYFVGMRPDFGVWEDAFSPAEPDNSYVEGQPSGMMHIAAYQPPAPPAAATPALPAVRATTPAAPPAPARPRPATPATAAASTSPGWFSSATAWFTQIWEPSTPTPETSSTYTVRPGDSLSRIARIHKVPLKSLAAANGIDLQKPLIRPGQKLRIPLSGARPATAPKPTAPAPATPTPQPAVAPTAPAAAPQPAATPKPAAPAPTTAPLPAGQYRIMQGDTPYGIARKHGISLQALLQANNLNEESARNLRIGTILNIPSQQHR